MVAPDKNYIGRGYNLIKSELITVDISWHLTSAPHFFRQEHILLSDQIGANHHRPPVGI